MPLLLEVKESSISSILNTYRRVYKTALNLTNNEQQNPPDLMSHDQSSFHTKKALISPEERSASKYFGHMILESLVELSASTSQEIREALSCVDLFYRSKEAPGTNPYSFIQSILVPDLFYIELGHFTTIDFHIEGSNYQRSLEHLNELKRSGFVPLLPQDLKNAERIRFRPRGVSNLPGADVECGYSLNHAEEPSLLTRDVLNTFFKIFSEIQRQFMLKNYDDNKSEIEMKKIDLIYRKSELFKDRLVDLIKKIRINLCDSNNQYQPDLTQGISSILDSDSRRENLQDRPNNCFFNKPYVNHNDTDSDHSSVDDSNSFTTYPQPGSTCDNRQSNDDMEPYEKYKRR